MIGTDSPVSIPSFKTNSPFTKTQSTGKTILFYISKISPGSKSSLYNYKVII